MRDWWVRLLWWLRDAFGRPDGFECADPDCGHMEWAHDAVSGRCNALDDDGVRYGVCGCQEFRADSPRTTADGYDLGPW